MSQNVATRHNKRHIGNIRIRHQASCRNMSSRHVVKTLFWSCWTTSLLKTLPAKHERAAWLVRIVVPLQLWQHVDATLLLLALRSELSKPSSPSHPLPELFWKKDPQTHTCGLSIMSCQCFVKASTRHLKKLEWSSDVGSSGNSVLATEDTTTNQNDTGSILWHTATKHESHIVRVSLSLFNFALL